MINIVKYAFNQVDIAHQWAVEWKKVESKLVRGSDKHGFFKIVEDMQNSEGYDNDKKLISRMIEANDWIKKHNLRAYTK